MQEHRWWWTARSRKMLHKGRKEWDERYPYRWSQNDNPLSNLSNCPKRHGHANSFILSKEINLTKP